MIRLNNVPINVTKFPDGTSQVWKLTNLESSIASAEINWEFEDEGEIFHLWQLVDLLHEEGNRYRVLHLGYLPYGRQDKNLTNSQTFALRSFAELINLMRFNSVICLDPHSGVAENLIRNFSPIYAVADAVRALIETKSDIICFPDAGARDKYAELFGETPRVHAHKVRDQSTGELTFRNIIGDVKDKNILIVDDICDGGGTFIGVTNMLYLRGAKEVNLFVTHGLFTKGLQPLFDVGIKRIFSIKGEHKL